MKRSGTISFHAKMPSQVSEDGQLGPPPELDAVRDALRAADPQLAELEFRSWMDEQENVWYEADADGFFLIKDLKRIAEHPAKTVRPECETLVWISDEDGNESVWKVFRDTVKRDEYL